MTVLRIYRITIIIGTAKVERCLDINKNIKNVDIKPEIEMPKCSDIYISTKTRTCELNCAIDLYNIFWKLNVIKYHTPIEGIIKKSMKYKR